jgi:hypothetical protein
MVGKRRLEAKLEARADCAEGKESEEEAKKWQVEKWLGLWTKSLL